MCVTEPQRWIQDYRSAGEVDWPDGLRAAIEAQFRQYRLKMRLWLLLLPIGFVTAIFLGLLGESLFDSGNGVAGLVSGSVVGFVAVGIGLLKANDNQKEKINAYAAMRSTRLEKFELGQHILDIVAAQRSIGEPVSLEGVPRVLYVVPEASLVVQVDGVVLDCYEEVHVRVVQGQAPKQEMNAVETDQMPLSQNEIQEIRSYIKSTKRHWKWLYLVYAAFSAGFLTRLWQFMSGELSRDDLVASIVGSVIWLLLTLLIIGPHRHTRRFLRDLRADVRHGMTEIIEGPRVVAQLVEAGDMKIEPRVKPNWVRRLSASGIWWEVDGVPAGWRRSP